VRRRSAIFTLFHALIATVIIGQCAASLALVVRADWHEAAHQHHAREHHGHPGEDHPAHEGDAQDGEDEDHTCPVVQLAHGFWDAPGTPLLIVKRAPRPAGALTFPDTARLAPALVLSASVLEHGPPVGA